MLSESEEDKSCKASELRFHVSLLLVNYDGGSTKKQIDLFNVDVAYIYSSDISAEYIYKSIYRYD